MRGMLGVSLAARSISSVGRTYIACAITGAITLEASNSMLSPINRILLPSKVFACCRRTISSMRGCCHCPGVDTAGDCVCCCGVPGLCGAGWSFCGVKLSLGRTLLAVDASWDVVDCCEGSERMRDVVDMVAVGVAVQMSEVIAARRVLLCLTLVCQYILSFAQCISLDVFKS